MNIVVIILQIIIALGIFNVWVLRYGKATEWRGGGARNMKEEFSVYGLPVWVMGVVGALKIFLAACLIAGLWFPEVTKPAAVGMAVLMLGAVTMHFKARDPVKRSLPAMAMLAMSLLVAVL